MVDYTNYDYDEVVARITEILSNKEGWGDAYDSSMGQSLIRLVADATDYLHYMLERRTVENYISTAKTLTAAISRASELGYRFRRAIANTGVVELTLSDNDGVPTTSLFDATIPKYTALTFGDKKFVTVEDVTISAGESTVNVRVKSGELETELFPLSALDDSNYVLVGGEDYTRIDEDSLRVTSLGDEFFDVQKDVDGSPERRAMSFLEPDEKFYDIRYSVEGMRLIFGDDFFGKKPDGDISVRYIVTPVDDEPVNSINNQFEDIAVADEFSETYVVKVKNTTKINSGEPAEGIASIKRNAQTYHKTNGRAVTPEDVSYWVKRSRIAGIRDATTIGEHELDTLVYNTNNVYVTYLKQDTAELSPAEENQLRNYMKTLLVGSMYPIFRNAEKLSIGVDLEARKNPSLEVSNSEVYQILRNYFINLFAVEEGSIDKEIQHSEIVRDLQQMDYTVDGISSKLLDYLKLELNAYFPFSVPVQVSNATVNIASTYTVNAGDSFVLNLSNVVCETFVEAGDDYIAMLERMRDKIMDITPYIAKVQFGDIAVDGFGFPLPITVDGTFGEGVLIGTDTPYISPTEMIQPPAVGSAIAKVSLNSPAVTVEHFYYATPAGRRPLIPLRDGTTVSFTAPSDTAVEVYVRDVLQDETTESLLTTVNAGSSFSQTFSSGEHGLQVEYVADSSEDVVVTIDYPQIADFSAGLNITTKDGFGTFTLDTNTGDIQDHVITAFKITVPQISREIKTNEFNVLPSSLSILDANGQTILNSVSDGRLIDTNGVYSDDGRVDYFTGTVTIPSSLPDGDYYVKYSQNKFQNFKTDRTSALVLSDISETETLPELFSKITTE